MLLFLTEEDLGMLVSSVCIVLLVLAERGEKGTGIGAGEGSNMGQLTLGKIPARKGIYNHVQEATTQSKGSFLA